MNAIHEALEVLKENAKRLEDLANVLPIAIPPCSLNKVYASLKAALPSSFNIKLSIWFYDHDPEGSPRVSWEVWDEIKHYEAPTLEGAVASALAAHVKPHDPFADAQAALDDAAVEQDEPVLAG